MYFRLISLSFINKAIIRSIVARRDDQGYSPSPKLGSVEVEAVSHYLNWQSTNFFIPD